MGEGSEDPIGGLAGTFVNLLLDNALSHCVIGGKRLSSRQEDSRFGFF